MGFLSKVFDKVGDFVGGITGNGLLSAGSSLLGGFMQNESNSANAALQMDFQREMSNTSYQRAVKDMMAAGLNPMLAYGQGGASTPSGASAVHQNVGEAGARGLASGAAASQAVATIDNIKTQSDLNRELTKKAGEDAKNASAQAANSRMETVIKGLSVPAIEAETKARKADADLSADLLKDPIGSGIMAGGKFIRNFFAPAAASASSVFK